MKGLLSQNTIAVFDFASLKNWITPWATQK